jgi:uncharacterized protein YjbI with pentapeptide repeats
VHKKDFISERKEIVNMFSRELLKESNKNLNILKQGVSAWNEWRKENPHVKPVLIGVDLTEKNLSEINLSNAMLIGANLKGTNLNKAYLAEAILYVADLSEAKLIEANLLKADLDGANLMKADLKRAILSHTSFLKANLSESNLQEANLNFADFIGANLTGVNLKGATLVGANLLGANLERANLIKTNLIGAILIKTNLSNAILKNCFIYGVSAWDLNLEGAIQSDLIITPSEKEFAITVDNLEIAQFIYLLLHNEKIRQVIDTITSKVVLILGRFTEERKKILDAIREKLREYNHIPILFDFEKPQSRDVIETVSILAHMSRCVIADITEPRTVPQELQAFVGDLKVPTVLILEKRKDVEYSGAEHFKNYLWVFGPIEYEDSNQLLNSLDNLIKIVEEFKKESISAIENVKKKCLKKIKLT